MTTTVYSLASHSGDQQLFNWVGLCSDFRFVRETLDKTLGPIDQLLMSVIDPQNTFGCQENGTAQQRSLKCIISIIWSVHLVWTPPHFDWRLNYIAKDNFAAQRGYSGKYEGADENSCSRQLLPHQGYGIWLRIDRPNGRSVGPVLFGRLFRTVGTA